MILTKLERGEFERILENYNIGRYRSHKHIWWALENTVYIIKTSKGRFILKIFERSDLDFIRYQVRIIDFLQNKKLPIPKIIKTKSDKNLLVYKNKKILIQKFIEGDEPNKINDKLTKDIGKSLGFLDKQLLKLKLQGEHTWGKIIILVR